VIDVKVEDEEKYELVVALLLDDTIMLKKLLNS